MAKAKQNLRKRFAAEVKAHGNVTDAAQRFLERRDAARAQHGSQPPPPPEAA